MKKPRLTLVGAGPGDADLITLKGVKAIQHADAVLYDALVNTELLDLAPACAPRVFVGKRAGEHSLPQEEINALIVQYAKSHGHVVRLKGGDPFVFGRGYEELQHASEHQIPVEVVPGISSAIALPALQQVPITNRGMAQSFWVVTATTKTGDLSSDIHLVAQSSATAVILMGMKKLPEIMAAFAQTHRADEHVMIVQNGSTPDERVAVGKVSNIAQIAQERGLGCPAIIVVGKVVGLHPLAQAQAHTDALPESDRAAYTRWISEIVSQKQKRA